MPAVHAHGVDVRAEHFADPQPVQREQRDQRVVTCRAESGLDEESAEFVAVDPEGA